LCSAASITHPQFTKNSLRPTNIPSATHASDTAFVRCRHYQEEIMGRGILLWLLGVPIPVIILLALLWH
jgi:hypothetical protein